ncbi:condensation domain protein [Mycobacterium xenopi 3993]|nr:condensation domain protein [Mycobacterium xenopi 3993]
MVARHESLRTVFPAVDGVARQVVVSAEWADIGWQVVDVAGWPPGRLQESIEQAAHHSFDLAAEIPLRAGLFRLADDEHVLVVVVHHIAADGWSITPLVRDLGLAYGARCAGGSLIGIRCRCSTPITRCGSAPSSVISMTVRA